MIQIVPEVGYLEDQAIRLEPEWGDVLIKVTSTTPIDIAIVDRQTKLKFDRSQSGDDVDIDWDERKQFYQRKFNIPEKGEYFLLLWNSNKNEETTIAYDITPLTLEGVSNGFSRARLEPV